MNEYGMQSALHAATGSGAALIAELSTVLFVGAALLFLFVIGLLVRAVSTGEAKVDSRRWIIGGGVVLPLVLLSLLLLYALAVGNTLTDMSARGPLRFVLDCISSGARAMSLPLPEATPPCASTSPENAGGGRCATADREPVPPASRWRTNCGFPPVGRSNSCCAAMT
jgi:hypothetical protein